MPADGRVSLADPVPSEPPEMSPNIDLHAHSTRSDGTLTPTALVQRARANGVDVLALTDHDSVDGIAEAAQEAGCPENDDLSAASDGLPAATATAGGPPVCQPPFRPLVFIHGV
jgi:hypothetical protein